MPVYARHYLNMLIEKTHYFRFDVPLSDISDITDATFTIDQRCMPWTAIFRPANLPFN